MRCTCLILVALAAPIVFGCSDSSDLEKAQREAKTATAELEQLRGEFELAKLKAEKELAEARAKQAEAEGNAAASEADADTSKAALGFIGMANSPAVSQPDPEWTPRELLAAYFNVPSWYHRVPLVKDCERVEPLMKSHYQLARIKPMEFEVLQLTPESTEVGNTLTATVKLATHSADYVIFRSAEGYRIDWEASAEKWLAAKDARFREAHGLVDASIEVKLVKRRESAGPFTELTYEITNCSDAHLAGASIEATAFGENGRYLQKGSCHIKDLPPGESIFESIVFLIAPSDLRTWNLKIIRVEIRTSSGGTEYVDKYFKLNEVQNNAPSLVDGSEQKGLLNQLQP